VASILLRRDELLGANVYGAAGWWSGEEVVESFKKVTGKPAVYAELPSDVWKGFMPNEVIGQEMLENFLLIKDYKYFGLDAEEGVAKAQEVSVFIPVREEMVKVLMVRSVWMRSRSLRRSGLRARLGRKGMDYWLRWRRKSGF
jgi:hypothetical protein